MKRQRVRKPDPTRWAAIWRVTAWGHVLVGYEWADQDAEALAAAERRAWSRMGERFGPPADYAVSGAEPRPAPAWVMGATS